MSDTALRKKKNANAQATFRQRRANYIATLEETVTSLESVLLQLQDSCREARSEAGDLQQDNARLRHELRERERFWRALWPAKKTEEAPESDDLPLLPSRFASPSHPQRTNINNRTSSSHGHYSDDIKGYQTSDETSNSLGSSSYISAPTHSYVTQSPALSYTNVETEQITSGGAGHHTNARVSRYGSYSYLMQPINGDGPCIHNAAQTLSANGSPTMTSSDVYANCHFEEQKTQLNHLETTSYLFPSSGSISPTSSTPASSSSMSLTSPFQLMLPADGTITQGRAEFDYRRYSNTHGAYLTLHGGTADISLPSMGSDGVCYRLGPCRASSGPSPLLPSLPQLSGSKNSLHHEWGGSEGGAASYSKLQPRRRRSRELRSPSPGAPPIPGTLAVIKAQYFGTLRRIRTRT
ncbi:uncharacterized protein F5147DRAFT_720601 [Suillus discolor]|uniref:BZIP domain-containing protein n=1 Tax=Suillus discolor TaxID=1912936 RepID=A0A9P7JNF8_9AGAM|nr:uncharacterized protein F5147DRAFT_720601 [Suillus discolor]KAG2093745.1 hypothetical protein F5147DRAFT_720601 [Suillus discolor]